MPAQIFSISLYRGRTPLDLRPLPGIDHPVLTGQSVTDMPAEFVADPFMVRANGLWHMFFEVMNKHTWRGAIGLATSPDGISWRYGQIVLDEPFHLSYPYVFAHGGEHYMVPETERTGTVRLYRADPFPFRWRFETVVCRHPLADPSLIRWEERWWLFGSTGNRRLHLFHTAELDGPWQEHVLSPVAVNSRADGIRPSGRLTPWKSGFLRFAQDCENAYGVCVRSALITSLSPASYAEEPVGGVIVGPAREKAGNGWNSGGMHHIDPHRLAEGRWLACVDGWFEPENGS